jgi:hypothetical protein
MPDSLLHKSKPNTAFPGLSICRRKMAGLMLTLDHSFEYQVPGFQVWINAIQINLLMTALAKTS